MFFALLLSFLCTTVYSETFNCGAGECGEVNCTDSEDCTVNCGLDDNRCEGSVINCPSDGDCVVDCTPNGGAGGFCGNATVNCENSNNCTVLVSGTRAFKYGILNCPTNGADCYALDFSSSGKSESMAVSKIYAQSSGILNIRVTASNGFEGSTVYCPEGIRGGDFTCYIECDDVGTSTPSCDQLTIYTIEGFNDLSITDEANTLTDDTLFCGIDKDLECIIEYNGTAECAAGSPSGNQCETYIVPTLSPSSIPTIEPTNVPTQTTVPPTTIPTDLPSIPPTPYPTPAPTFSKYDHKTVRDTSSDGDGLSYNLYSENVYPLSWRNQTYSSFTVPTGAAYCSTCVLAWADLDATITVEGCDDLDFGVVNSNGYVEEPGAFFECNGTWKLTTTGALVDWQQTYGRLEIWEVDDWGRKYSQWYFEFQWNKTNCSWINIETNETADCDLLPLTSNSDISARFEFTMPKEVGDNRNAPLIVVWYDLLLVPYALRPILNYTWWNLTFPFIEESNDLTLEEAYDQFEFYIYAAGILVIGFCIIMIIACIYSDENITKQDYMLDTRDIRSTFIHSVNTLIAPQSDLLRRNKFQCHRHGWWLIFILGARIAYMLVFNITFFLLAFRTLNDTSFDVLDYYNTFADIRDSQLLNMSSAIEGYYYNETERLEDVVEDIQFYCYFVYINETAKVYESGAIAQYNNHSDQMAFSLSGIDWNGTISSSIYITGDTACSTDTDDGAFIYYSDPYSIIYYKSNGDYNHTEYYYAKDYSRIENETKWTELETLLSTVCRSNDWCVGWTWIDEQYDNNTGQSYNQSYYLFSAAADPVNSDLEGICYAIQTFDSSLFDFSSISSLANYSDYLESLYLSDYTTEVDSLYDDLSEMWSALQDLTDEDNSNNNFKVVVNNDATDYSIDFEFLSYAFLIAGQVNDSSTTGTSTNYEMNWRVVVNCPSCPEGNFSSPYLEQVYEYLFEYNYTNLSDFVNTVGGAAPNFSDIVSVDASFIDYPDLPSIDLPFDIDVLPIDLDFAISIYITLDILLLIYRWYRTVGIMATIVRGKDVIIRNKFLRVETLDAPPCWSGTDCCDKCMGAVLWCHDKIRHCGYNLWKFLYWVWLVFRLVILVLIIVIAYYLVEQIVTEDFISELGTWDLLTIGIAAQRSVRNQVICTTALTYNNYSLDQIEDSRETYASEKNSDAWDWNKDELSRVDEFNYYFCNAYTTYQASVRDIIQDSSVGLTVDSVSPSQYFTVNELDNAFDNNINTSFTPNTIIGIDTILSVIIDLPAIQMTRDDQCYWEISQLEFDWTYIGSATSEIEYSAESANDTLLSWKEEDLTFYSYTSSGSDDIHDIQTNDVEWIGPVYSVRLNFSNIDDWISSGDSFSLNELTFYGSAFESCIDCQEVTFYYWDFDASDTYVFLCPSVTPVFGIMYRGWVRTWLTVQLKEGHGPFIRAVRNIILSPFYIALVGAVILVLVFLVAFIVEYILLKVNLYRLNPRALVHLVHARGSENYDSTLHDIDALNGVITKKDKTTYFGNSGTLLGQNSVGNSTSDIQPSAQIEHNIVNVELGNLRNKTNIKTQQRDDMKYGAKGHLSALGINSGGQQQNYTHQKDDSGPIGAGNTGYNQNYQNQNYNNQNNQNNYQYHSQQSNSEVHNSHNNNQYQQHQQQPAQSAFHSMTGGIPKPGKRNDQWVDT